MNGFISTHIYLPYNVYSTQVARTYREGCAQCIFQQFLSLYTSKCQQTHSCFNYLFYKYNSVAAWRTERQQFKEQRLSEAVQRRHRRETCWSRLITSAPSMHSDLLREAMKPKANELKIHWGENNNLAHSILRCCINKMYGRKMF